MDDKQISRRDVMRIAAAGGAVALLPKISLAAGPLNVPINPSDLSIAFGHVGPINDEGWTWTHHLARQAVEKAYPDAKIIEVENIPFSAKGSRTIRQMAARQPDIMFLSTDYGDLANPVIEANPEIAFLSCSAHDSGPNKRGFYVKHWDPSFLIGMAAGLSSKSGNLGYVGSFPLPGVHSSINAFHLGARSVNPNAKTNVIYINSWFDPQAASQAARALISGGADFLFGIMIDAAYLQVAEEKGIQAAMWNTDMRKYGPNAYVSSIRLDWVAYYLDQVAKRVEGKWVGDGVDLLPMAAGVDRDAWGQNVDTAIAKQVDELRAKMIAGYSPFVGPIKDNAGTLQIAAGETVSEDTLFGWPWLAEGVTTSS